MVINIVVKVGQHKDSNIKVNIYMTVLQSPLKCVGET